MPNNKLDKAKLFILFQPMWRENPLWPFFINTIGHLSQLHVTLGIVLGTLSFLFIAGLLLSPPQGPFCVVGRLERGKKWKRAGDDEKRKERKRGLFPLPIVHRAVTTIYLLLFLLEYQTGAPAEEPERGWAESIKTFPVQFDPALTQFHERP